MPEFLQQLDETWIFWVQEHLHNAFTDVIFPFFTYLGEVGAIWIAVGIILLFFKKYRWWGGLLLFTLLTSYIAGDLILKNIVCRPRPCQDFPQVPLLIAAPSSFSFPSGHSLSGMACACILCRFHKKLGIPSVLLALLIAFSRVFLFVHYPIDVLTGLVLGILWAWFIWKGVQFTPLRHHYHEERLTSPLSDRYFKKGI